MVELQINTTQNVNINFTAASVGERILAYAIDWLIKIAYMIAIFQVLFNVIGIEKWFMDLDNWSIIAILLLFYMPVIFYSLLFETLLDGQTLGKRIMKIKVVKIDGYQAALSDFVIRWFFRIVDMNILSGVVALIAIVTSPKNQRLGDITAGTAVITLKNNITINHTILEEIRDDYQPTYPNVIRLSDNDARIIKDTFLMARRTRDYKTMIRLREKVVEVVGIKTVKQNNDAEFIDTILKDYNYFTQNM
ncbi:MAG: RDD family protein [Flavobacteriaceae bacterium]|nr:RDD family protein [Bacteroidia bacterium]MBT8288034.1 RDD family protein [Bacteroidia bacterium]NNF75860.1 RDD family protein [Flavobacteriaceae bacterium]NNK73085.1 RDD family protein [Flavobacteriaceae bacterium]